MNCKFHLEDSDYDSGVYYYCNLDETFMVRYFDKMLPKDLFEEASEWGALHVVQENGICNGFCLIDK
jgi:hypothetical protein